MEEWLDCLLMVGRVALHIKAKSLAESKEYDWRHIDSLRQRFLAVPRIDRVGVLIGNTDMHSWNGSENLRLASRIKRH